MNLGTMHAAVLHGSRDVRLEQVPLRPLSPGELRVKIDTALTCGTDVKVYRRGEHARMIHPPALFGHEWAGTVMEISPGLTSWQVGDRVTGANSAACTMCIFCKLGRSELCEDLQFLNGAYAETIVVPARFVQRSLYRVPESLAFHEAALAEPLACVVRGLELMPVMAGETVAVLGLGPIGLLFVRLAALAGANVIAVGRRSSRLTLAREFGACEVLDEGTLTDPARAVRSQTPGGHGPDRVIEAVGTPKTWELAIAMVRKAGAVNLFGGCPAGSSIQLDTHRIHYDEITLLGAFHHTPSAYKTALDLLAARQVDAGALISQTVALTELPEILGALADGRLDIVKAAVKF